MARIAKAKARAPLMAPMRGLQGWKWWHGMALGILLTLSPGTALLLAALSAPAVLVLVADTTRGRVLGRTVILFSLAGAIEPLRAYILGSYDINAALQILGRPTTIPVTWMMGAGGWLADELFCVLAAFIATMRLTARRKSLEALLASICKEWEIPE